MSVKSTAWSDMEIAQLKALVGTMSRAKIAAQIGRSPDAVKNQIGRLNLDKPQKRIHPIAQVKPVAPDPRQKFLVRILVFASACLASMSSEDRERTLRSAERAVQHLKEEERLFPSPLRRLVS